VERIDCNTQSTVFDNTALQDGDIFVATLLRPGYHYASNQQGAKCAISITHSKISKFQLIPTRERGIIRPNIESLTIECTASGFKPEKVNVQAAQTFLFMIRVPSRIKIEYKTAEKQEAQASP
jgi:hypothetical protein